MAEVYSLHTVELERHGEALLDVIAQQVPGLSKNKVRTAIMSGLAKIDDVVINDVHYVLPEKKVQLKLDLRHGLELPIDQQMAQRPFKILYIDKDIVVVDKAAGILASQPRRLEDEKTVDSHLSDIVGRTLKKMGKDIHYVGYVHRLDQETSGCICLALNKEAHRHLAEQFATKEANRIYRCIVTGQPVQDKDTLKGLIVRGIDGRRRLVREELPGEHGETAITEFKVIERFDGGADCEVRLLTGRTHQVRVSMAAIAAPVFGDSLYGEKKKTAPRMMLHAWKLTLTHPKTELIMTFEAPLPEEFSSCRPPKARKGERTTAGKPETGFDEDRNGQKPYRSETSRPRSRHHKQHDQSRETRPSEARKYGEEKTEKRPYQERKTYPRDDGASREQQAPQRAPREYYKPNVSDARPAAPEARDRQEHNFSSRSKTPWKTNPKRIDKPRDTVQYNKNPAKVWKDKSE